jgi:hypothetical protein
MGDIGALDPRDLLVSRVYEPRGVGSGREGCGGGRKDVSVVTSIRALPSSWG